LWNNGDDSILAVKPQMMGVAKLTEGKQTVASVFLVKGSYEFQAFSGSSVASSRVKYDLLDSQWIYVYFCSRRQGVERKTDANMVGWLMAETIRKTEFDPSAMLFPLSGKVTLAVGAFGAGFSSFNGLLAKVRFVLGGGECFSAAELAKIVSEKPGVPTLL
jgi:hypothetical protein